jgi:hypothetical protein
MGVMIAIDRRYMTCSDRKLRQLFRELSALLVREEFADPLTRPQYLQAQYEALVEEFAFRGVQIALFR